MSHLKERDEKICLNCNAATYGRFCHVCGQENIETKESFWHLAGHFVADIFHYDGKFFRTIRYLLLRPGFLTREYINGRRTTYLHPIRLYVFTSAVFFLIFFNFFYKQEDLIKMNNGNDKKQKSLSVKESYEKLREIKDYLKVKLSKKTSKYITNELKSLLQETEQDSILITKDSSYVKKLDLKKYSSMYVEFINFSDTSYSNISQYDSIQAILNSKDRDNFIQRYFQHKNLAAREVTKGLTQADATSKILDSFFHKFPQMLFVYLPFFSLSLMLLYVRNKQLFYVNHVVFSIHLFCSFFILMLLNLLLSPAIRLINIHVGKGFLILLHVLIFYKSFKNFYQQSRFKTILKLFFLAIINFFIIAILVVIFSMIAALNIH